MTITRRRLLALLPPFLTSGFAGAQTLPGEKTLLREKTLFAGQTGFLHRQKAAATPTFVYIGTDTAKAGAKGIYRARFDAKSGRLTEPELVAETPRPVYMALNQVRDRRLLYVTNEGDSEATSLVSAFAIDNATGALSALGQVSSGGVGPCYVSVDATGQSAYVANYMGGTVAAFAVLPDGRLSSPRDRVDFHADPRFGDHEPAPGPRKDRQDAAHPHSTTISPDNAFVLVNDLGGDAIAIFPLDPKTAHLGPATVVPNRIPGSGPRHLAFHPNGRWVYGIDELANRIDQYLWTEAHAAPGRPAQAILTDTGHPVSTIADGLTGTNTASEIAVESTGRFVYASNRGVENSLVVFAVEPTAGTLSLLQRIDCGGKGPRHFTLDPSQRWLLCGNQNSASVTVFARDAASGRLSGPVQTVALESPMYTLFV